MKLLLDECVDSRLAGHLGTHSVATVASRGWTGITDGKLLTLAQTEFDIFFTVDRNLSFQQHLPKYNIAVAVLIANTNRIDDLVQLVPALLENCHHLPRASLRGFHPNYRLERTRS